MTAKKCKLKWDGCVIRTKNIPSAILQGVDLEKRKEKRAEGRKIIHRDSGKIYGRN